MIGPAVDGKIDWDKTIGIGGYSLASERRGVSMNLKRNPNSWKEGRAHFDEAQLLGINDAGARMNAMATGELDAISNPELKRLSLLARDLVVPRGRRAGYRLDDAPTPVIVFQSPPTRCDASRHFGATTE